MTIDPRSLHSALGDDEPMMIISIETKCALSKILQIKSHLNDADRQTTNLLMSNMPASNLQICHVLCNILESKDITDDQKECIMQNVHLYFYQSSLVSMQLALYRTSQVRNNHICLCETILCMRNILLAMPNIDLQILIQQCRFMCQLFTYAHYTQSQGDYMSHDEEFAKLSKSILDEYQRLLNQTQGDEQKQLLSSHIMDFIYSVSKICTRTNQKKETVISQLISTLSNAQSI